MSRIDNWLKREARALDIYRAGMKALDPVEARRLIDARWESLKNAITKETPPMTYTVETHLGSYRSAPQGQIDGRASVEAEYEAMLAHMTPDQRVRQAEIEAEIKADEAREIAQQRHNLDAAKTGDTDPPTSPR